MSCRPGIYSFGFLYFRFCYVGIRYGETPARYLRSVYESNNSWVQQCRVAAICIQTHTRMHTRIHTHTHTHTHVYVHRRIIIRHVEPRQKFPCCLCVTQCCVALICVYIYSYVQAYIFSHVHTHTHTHVYVDRRMVIIREYNVEPARNKYTYIHKQVYIHTNVCMYVCMYVEIFTYACVCVYVYMYVHTYMYVYVI